MYAVKFPKQLERSLYDKLKGKVFDIGKKVKIVVDEEEEKIELKAIANGLKEN